VAPGAPVPGNNNVITSIGRPAPVAPRPAPRPGPRPPAPPRPGPEEAPATVALPVTRVTVVSGKGARR
jgi:hypothetical protein